MTQEDPTIEDIEWLTGPEGERCLAELAGAKNTAVADKMLFGMARRMGNVRASLASMTFHLRERARRKFAAAERMFFTPTALEQATDSTLARYKASRFPKGQPLADLCCGIGGDLLALAKVGQVTGVDLDPLVVLFAQANATAFGQSCDVVVGSAEDFPLESVAAWHIDPDRRSTGRRTTGVDEMEPDAETISELLARNPNAAIKLAPATELPEEWSANGEREWLGWNRECQQQVAWFGSLRSGRGGRVATIVVRKSDAEEVESESIGGEGDEPIPIADRLGKFVYEPVAPVLAAHLTGALAARENCAALAPGIVYFTSDDARSTRLMQAFEVLDELPFDRRKLKARLRDLQLGRLEIKVRGIDESPEKLRKELAVDGEESAALLIYRGREKKVKAIIARRVL